MKSLNKKLNTTLVYKILIDVLILSLISFSLLLLAETILPQIIITHVSFLKLFSLVIFLLILTIYIGKKHEIEYKLELKKTNTTTVLGLLFFAIIIFISLRNFSLTPKLIISATSTYIIWIFLKETLKEK
ncbi:hypothetical protein ACFL3M_00725 [Patescibacteria group bacterium]